MPGLSTHPPTLYHPIPHKSILPHSPPSTPAPCLQHPLHSWSTCPSIHPLIQPCSHPLISQPSSNLLLSPPKSCSSTHPPFSLIHQPFISQNPPPFLTHHSLQQTLSNIYNLYLTHHPPFFVYPPCFPSFFPTRTLPTIHWPPLPQSTLLHPSIHHPSLPITLVTSTQSHATHPPSTSLNLCAFMCSLTIPQTSVPPPLLTSARTLRRSPGAHYQPFPVGS